jgi:UDP-N-acetylglucosamine--N-acetylmuramyl-(pentapeptide) pyrophosphoryl-undecaprenol N-acetylglucosamine transferase
VTRIVIAAGGTAGHVVPAIAVADALRAEGAEVVFIGGERAEAELVPAAGYRFEAIRVEGISRTNPLKAARAIGRAVGGFGAALKLLRRLHPDVVLGGGGYVAGPVGAAAALMRIPVVLTEADSHLGITNRALAPVARRVCLAFPIPGRSGAKYRITGRPVPPRESDRAGARAELGIGTQETCVLVFGGSLGARSINRAAVEAFAGARFRVLHVAGKRDFAELQSPGPHYILRDYVTPFGKALAAADLVVGRAGGSVFEVALYGLPSILIPFPHASADHQTANARFMAGEGAAVIVPDAEISAPRLAREVGELLADPSRLKAMADAAARVARPDAAADVAAEVLAAGRAG